MTHSSTSRAFPAAELDRRFYAFAFDRVLGWGAAIGLGAGLWVASDGENWKVAVGSGAGLLVALWLIVAISTGVTGRTPGKAIFGLRVVNPTTGAPIGVGSALVRELVLAVGGVPTFGFGVAALAWTAVAGGDARRGWHDQLSNAEVVDVRPVAVAQDQAADDAPRHVVNLTAMRLIPAPAVRAPASPRAVDSDHSMRREPLAKDLAPAATASGIRAVPPGATPVPSAGSPTPVPGLATPPPATPTPQPGPSQPAPTPTSQPGGWGPGGAHRAPAPAAPTGWGAPTPAPTPPPAAPVPAPAPTPGQGWGPPTPTPAGRWRATFDDGHTFLIEGLALVGRRPEPRPGEQVRHLVPLRSPEMSVSKTHAQFGPAADGVIVVTDRGSTNGTVLIRQGAGRQLTAGKPATLRDGDKVMFGDRGMTLTREA